MATQSQIHANRQNATHSTGARTESGKQTSSQNHLTLGLYTRTDYVKPEERDFYKEFCETTYSELSPTGMLEDTLASEIIGASWRLRRCSAAEGELADYALSNKDAAARPYPHDGLSQIASGRDPLLDDKTEKTRRSIDRARASAHSHFHRAINQLRKMQTERAVRMELYGEDMPGLAECRKTEAVRKKHRRDQKSAAAAAEDIFMQQVRAFCDPAPSVLNQTYEDYLGALETTHPPSSPQPLASNCQAETAAVAEAPDREEVPEENLLHEATEPDFFTLDEESQLRLLAEEEENDSKFLEDLLKAA